MGEEEDDNEEKEEEKGRKKEADERGEMGNFVHDSIKILGWFSRIVWKDDRHDSNYLVQN